MKKLRLLILTMLLIHFYCNGQLLAPCFGAQVRGNNLNYDALVDTTKLWSVSIQYANIQYSMYYKVSDTITIGNNLYSKVYETNDSLLLDWNFTGYIRENGSNEVYFRNSTGDEGLIYSFDLSANDSILVYNPLVCPEFSSLIVSSTDSVWLGNSYRKRIFFYNSNNDDYWTEGIGSKFGLLFSNYCFIGANYNLLCYYESDSLIYQNPNFECCYYPFINNISHNIEPVSFHINYCVNDRTLIINSPDIETSRQSLTLRICNLLGYEVFQCKLFNNRQIISTSHFSKGIYLVHIKSPSHLIYGSKILIL